MENLNKFAGENEEEVAKKWKYDLNYKFFLLFLLIQITPSSSSSRVLHIHNHPLFVVIFLLTPYTPSLPPSASKQQQTHPQPKHTIFRINFPILNGVGKKTV